MSISCDVYLSSSKVNGTIFKISKSQKYLKTQKKDRRRRVKLQNSKDWSRDDIVSLFLTEILNLMDTKVIGSLQNLIEFSKKRSDLDKYFPQRKMIAKKFLMKDKEINKKLLEVKNKKIDLSEADIHFMKRSVLDYLSNSKLLSKMRERRISENLEMYQFKGSQNYVLNEGLNSNVNCQFKNISVQFKKDDYKYLTEMSLYFGNEMFLDGKLACDFLSKQTNSQ
jgi:hypothetical protein